MIFTVDIFFRCWDVMVDYRWCRHWKKVIFSIWKKQQTEMKWDEMGKRETEKRRDFFSVEWFFSLQFNFSSSPRFTVSGPSSVEMLINECLISFAGVDQEHAVRHSRLGATDRHRGVTARTGIVQQQHAAATRPESEPYRLRGQEGCGAGIQQCT